MESELIGIRAFGRLVGVTHKAIQKAMDCGRITAYIRTPQGRKLRRREALEEWKQVSVPGNNNNFTERSMATANKRIKPKWYACLPPARPGAYDIERGPDLTIPVESRDFELCIRQAMNWLDRASECGFENPKIKRQAHEISKKVESIWYAIQIYYGGPEE